MAMPSHSSVLVRMGVSAVSVVRSRRRLEKRGRSDRRRVPDLGRKPSHRLGRHGMRGTAHLHVRLRLRMRVLLHSHGRRLLLLLVLLLSAVFEALNARVLLEIVLRQFIAPLFR